LVRNRRRRRDIRFELIPMIDVFMIITLFLTVMAFLPQISDSLKAELPSSQTVAAKPDTAVIIAADKHLAYEKVVGLIDQLKTAGIKRMALATAPADGSAH